MNSPIPELSPGSALPYAVLHHTGIDQPHFDLLLQISPGAPLFTWRIVPTPDTWSQHPPPTRRLADHRPIYMRYEGPISGNRGEVWRVGQGLAHVVRIADGQCQVRLEGTINCLLDLPLDPP